MCEHQFGESLEDCVLIIDPVTGRFRCWAHPAPPIPRQPTGHSERLRARMQGADP